MRAMAGAYHTHLRGGYRRMLVFREHRSSETQLRPSWEVSRVVETTDFPIIFRIIEGDRVTKINLFPGDYAKEKTRGRTEGSLHALSLTTLLS